MAASLALSAHRPEAGESSAELKTNKIDNTTAFMFESRYAMRLTKAEWNPRSLSTIISRAGKG
jgi:homogentisate 1,2-dioxygenase